MHLETALPLFALVVCATLLSSLALRRAKQPYVIAYILAGALAGCTLVSRSGLAQGAEVQRALSRVAETAGAASRAADDARPSRTLGGHYFIPSRLAASPLVTSNFGQLTGLGTARLHAHEEDYALAAYSQTFSAQLALARMWSLRASGSGFVFGGMDLESVLGFGANFGHSVGMGTTVASRIGSVQLASTLDVSWVEDFSLNVVDGVLESVEQGEPTPGALLRRQRTTEPAIGFHAAWGVSHALGLRAGVTHSSQWSNKQIPAATLEPRVGLDLDLAQAGVPVGTLLAYSTSYNAFRHRQRGAAHTLSSGLFYTGRRELSLGVELRHSWRKPTPGTRFTVLQGLISMRYFWRVPD